jgi:beta-glucuronidase
LGQNDQGKDPGLTEKWYETGIPAGVEKLKVYVPSSWCYYQNRKNFYHFGIGWYETNFFIPYDWGSGDGKKVTLVFNGVNYKTTVWVNGQYVGTHEGGYTKFWFEINPYVVFGSDNLIIIQVDNRYKEGRIPWFRSPDWMNYGGILRSVYLKLTSKVCIDDFKITSAIQFDKPLGEKPESWQAAVNFRFNIKDFRPTQRNFEGSVIINLKDKETLYENEIPVKLGKNGEEFAQIQFEIQNPNLWSPEYPYLYDITFQLLDSERHQLDREAIRWGFREFKIRDKFFYFNNEKYILRGISRHEDHPEVGSSMSPRLIYNDLSIMKDANINCIRTSHYPPYEALIELADEMGFIILEEIPLWQLKKSQFTSQYLVNAQQQLWEMIHRDKNHTSVVAWLISNECETDSIEGREFMKALIEMSRELDPSRYHTIVTHHPLLDNTLDLVDFICVNLYVGWYNDYNVKPAEVGKVIDNIWDRIENDEEVGGIKPLVISEFGAEAISGYKSFENAHWSETYQYDLLQTYIRIMMDKGNIAGSIIWHFQDFRVSPHGGFLQRPREYNNKGIVDMHRNPKVSYFIVQRLYGKWKEKK